jgi:hypothetical protein
VTRYAVLLVGDAWVGHGHVGVFMMYVLVRRWL